MKWNMEWNIAFFAQILRIQSFKNLNTIVQHRAAKHAECEKIQLVIKKVQIVITILLF